VGVPIRSLDVIVILAYLAGLVAVALYFSRRNTNTEEYFVGNRSFPGWAIGLSMLGTSISSVTFLAFPAAAYVLDWRQLVSNLMLPLVAVLAIMVFIPFFRRGQLTSAFEYLEDRFNPAVRLYGTLSFILLQLIRLGKILFLVSIPISLLSGVEIHLVIVGLGLFIGFYTILGGFDAVIWTDVVQSIVLWFGGLFCFGYIAWQLPDGLGQIFTIGSEHEKFHVGSLQFNFHERTFWTVALLGIFNWLAMYSSDQNFVQRYAAAKSLRAARSATMLYTALTIPTWTFFFFLGTCVFVFYRVFPDPGVGSLEADQIFPWFILTQIPAGVSGLVIASVLAAAMSSLDSSINSIVTVDLLQRHVARGRDDGYYLRASRWIATGTAGLMIFGAIVFGRLEKESLNDLSWMIASVFGGCLVGLFMIGFFTTRVDSSSAIVGLLVAVLVNVYLGINVAGWLPAWMTVPMHSYWVAVVVNLLFVVLAYGLSLRRPRRTADLSGLTVWTMQRKGETRFV
jgi:SSS family solute:Na+ symporter